MKQRFEILGCQVDNLTLEETVQEVERLILSGQPHEHVGINVDKVVQANKDPDLRRIINESALSSVDGMPIVWASRLLGKPLKERVTGVDLVEVLMRYAAQKGWRIFLLGAKEAVVSKAVQIYTKKYPGLLIVGYRNGYWVASEEAEIVQQIKDAKADILLVGISSPQKEQFLSKYQSDMQVPFAMGVGGTFDVMAGNVKRAPLWIQKVGFEWFYRFLQEPKRMFRRYFIDDMVFFRLLLQEVLNTKIKPSNQSA